MTPEVQLRVASLAEHRALNELYARWGYHGGIAANDMVFVATTGGRPVGVTRRARESGLLMLRGMQVDPAFQRRRIGTLLLRTFADALPPEPCYCIPFSHLTGFYGQEGFDVVDEEDAPDFLRGRLRQYRAEGHSVLVMRRLPPLQHDRAR